MKSKELINQTIFGVLLVLAFIATFYPYCVKVG